MLAALILHTFQIVFSGHRNHTLFSQRFPAEQALNFLRFSHANNAIQSRGVPRERAVEAETDWNPNPRRKFGLRITYPKQEDSHAIQACYFGPRGRLIVRGDGDRVGADAAGSGGLERRQRRTGRYRHRYQDEISQDEISQDEIQQDEVWHDNRNEYRLQEGRSS
jgi:hypothetical protein